MRDILLLTIELGAVIHLLLSVIFFFFAKRTVRYLSQAWIMLLIGAMYAAGVVFVLTMPMPDVAMLPPIMSIYLLVSSYLLSIYPLGMSMPGYLQWRRMWLYATPAIVLIAGYGLGSWMGWETIRLVDYSTLRANLSHPDVWLRLGMLGLSAYYIVNIFRLPHKLARHHKLPSDIIAYGTALGMESVFFIGLTISFSPVGLIGYILSFSAVNLFLSFRALRPLLLSIDTPKIEQVPLPPTIVPQEEDEEDFNETNRKRFEMAEYIMQHERPFMDCDFNRDKLCKAVGFNRHLLLESLRSQGYNDVHEYITRYRVAELRKQVEAGAITDIADCHRIGLKTPATALKALERYEGISFEELLKKETKNDN